MYDAYSSSIYVDGVKQGKCWFALCNYARQRSPGDLAIVEGFERKATGRLSLDLLCCKVLEAFFSFLFPFEQSHDSQAPMYSFALASRHLVGFLVKSSILSIA
jgi:hypothetical protein